MEAWMRVEPVPEGVQDQGGRNEDRQEKPSEESRDGKGNGNTEFENHDPRLGIARAEADVDSRDYRKRDGRERNRWFFRQEDMGRK